LSGSGRIRATLSCATSFRSKRILTTPSCWYSAAHERGIRPYSVSSQLGLMSSRSKSIFTISSCPMIAAHMRGVRLDLGSAWSGLTSCRSKSIFTTCCRPRRTAQVRAVLPVLSVALTSHSFISNTGKTISTIPRNATPCNPVNRVGPEIAAVAFVLVIAQ